MTRIHLLLATLFMSACASTRGGQSYIDSRCDTISREGECTLWDASLVELIARPDVFDGKRVRVIGFVNLEFEGNALYLSKTDYEQSIARNGLWIDPPSPSSEGSATARSLPNREYVIVEAVFRAGRGGHFGMWSGTLTDVTRLDRWGRIAPDTIPIRPLLPPPA